MLAAIVLAATLPHRAIAITFDDLPAAAIPASERCDAKAIGRWNVKLLATLKRHHAPALGLANGRPCLENLASILNLWLDAGHDLGNHTFSHRDLNSIPLTEYERDIIRGETPLRDLLRRRGKRLIYFRHPFLHTGTTSATRDALGLFLRQHNYVVAPVTVDSQEWVFAAAYARALERGDAGLARRLTDAYLPFMEEIADWFERRSVVVVGREFPQILLLHMNALNANRLDPLLTMLERRGYRFITVDEALRDPAYALPDGYVGPKGFSWIERWAAGKGMPVVQEPREPAWVREASSSPQ